MFLLVVVVVQLVEALLYKPEVRGFDFRWRKCNFYSDCGFY
jgi:hypothetical protein